VGDDVPTEHALATSGLAGGLCDSLDETQKSRAPPAGLSLSPAKQERLSRPTSDWASGVTTRLPCGSIRRRAQWL
jgi:hypothetical protein